MATGLVSRLALKRTFLATIIDYFSAIIYGHTTEFIRDTEEKESVALFDYSRERRKKCCDMNDSKTSGNLTNPLSLTNLAFTTVSLLSPNRVFRQSSFVSRKNLH